MAKKISIIEKDVVRAIEWAAAEYKFLQELKKELAEAEKENLLSKEEQGLHKALRILIFVSRAERRAYIYEHRVYEDLQDLYKEWKKDPELLESMQVKTKSQFIEQRMTEAKLLAADHLGEGFSSFQDIIQILRDLKIGEETLAKWVSLYGGLLKRELKKGEMLAKLEEDLSDKTNAEQTDRQLKKLLGDINQQIKNAETWVSSLEATLERAQQLLRKLEPGDKEVILQDGFNILAAYGFPIDKYSEAAQFLASHPTDLEEIAKATNNPPFVFKMDLTTLAEAVTLNERTWPEIVIWTIKLLKIMEDERIDRSFWREIIFFGSHNNLNCLELIKWTIELIKVTKNSKEIFVSLEFLQKAKIIDEKNWPEIAKFIIKIVQATEGDAGRFFDVVLPDLVIRRILDQRTLSKVFKSIATMCEEVGENAKFVLTNGLLYLLRTGELSTAEDITEIADRLASPELKISTYNDLLVFLHYICFVPRTRLKKPLMNIIAELMIKSISLERADIERNIPKIKKAFTVLLQWPNLDLETKFLLRRLSALLPLGGNEQLIYTIRNEAIALQEGSGNSLEPLRQKIHNFPGREDIDIIAAYLHFLSTDDTTSLEALCKLHRIRLDMKDVSQRRSSLLATQKTAESLLAHLNELWHFISADFSQQTAALEQQYANMEESHELKAVFSDVLKKTKKLEGLLAKGNKEKAAHLIGDLRFDVHFLQERTSGDLKNELYFFDLFLQAVDTDIHADVVGKISLNTWEDVLNITQLIIQKTFSIIAIYQSDVALAGAVKYLEDFRKNKSFVDLRESLEYFHYGIDYVLKKVIDDFKKIFKEKMAVSKKELEELVSPFYRTGPIFQLGQLVNILDTAQRSGQVKIIIKQEPRSVTTHLRERLYERLGLY